MSEAMAVATNLIAVYKRTYRVSDTGYKVGSNNRATYIGHLTVPSIS